MHFKIKVRQGPLTRKLALICAINQGGLNQPCDLAIGKMTAVGY